MIFAPELPPPRVAIVMPSAWKRRCPGTPPFAERVRRAGLEVVATGQERLRSHEAPFA